MVVTSTLEFRFTINIVHNFGDMQDMSKFWCLLNFLGLPRSSEDKKFLNDRMVVS